MNGRIIVVKASHDAEAGVWFVAASDIAGLNLEADTLEALVEKLPGAVQDLLESDGNGYDNQQEVPIELIANASTKVSSRSAA